MAKFVKVMEWIIRDNILDAIQIFHPSKASDEAVSGVHITSYVDSFVKGTIPPDEMRKTGFHWTKELVKRCFLEVGNACVLYP